MATMPLLDLVTGFQFESVKELKNQLSSEQLKQELLQRNYKGQTPLHLACELGYSKVVLELLTLSQGDNELLESIDSEGKTPLLVLVKSSDDGTPQSVELLLKAGADSNKIDTEGNTALHLAATMGQEELIQLLYQETPLMVSILEGQFNVFNMLLVSQADTSIQDKNGWTALHCAAITIGNSPAYIKLLGKKGDINTRDMKGNTALLLAASTSIQKHYRAMETLIKLNADLLLRNNDNKLAQDYIEEVEVAESQSDYFKIISKAYFKKGIVIRGDKDKEKRTNQVEKEIPSQDHSHSHSENHKEEEEDNHSEGEGSEESKKKKKSCCGGGSCGPTSEDGISCEGNCGCGPNECKIKDKKLLAEANKKRFDNEEKGILGAIIALTLFFIYLLIGVAMKSLKN